MSVTWIRGLVINGRRNSALIFKNIGSCCLVVFANTFLQKAHLPRKFCCLLFKPALPEDQTSTHSHTLMDPTMHIDNRKHTHRANCSGVSTAVDGAVDGAGMVACCWRPLGSSGTVVTPAVTGRLSCDAGSSFTCSSSLTAGATTCASMLCEEA